MTNTDHSRLYPLLVQARTGAPVLAEGLGPATTQRAASPEALAPAAAVKRRGDPGDLRRQRWGIIAPVGDDGDRLLDLVAPLIERRRDQQGAEVRIYRAPSGLSLAEAARWKKRHYYAAGTLETSVPAYQLILGDLHQVPLSIQQVQSSEGMVGRLAFDDDHSYRAYVDKLIRWEQRPAESERADAVLYTVRDRSPATRQGFTSLMGPGAALLGTGQRTGEVRAGEIRRAGSRRPSADEFWRAGQGERPGVLFSLGHGQGAPGDGWLSVHEQRREQGALSLGRGERIAAEDLAERAFLPGGIWFMLACFGAGTPARSVYQPWLRSLVDADMCGPEALDHIVRSLSLSGAPFIAALPKAALANPEGPLAVIGHIDLAWSYGFLDLDDGPRSRPGRFMNVVQRMLAGARVGFGFQGLYRFLNEVQTELTALYAERSEGRAADGDARARLARLSHLWMLRHDLAGYILLGDPAVRLPIRGRTEPAERIPSSVGTAVDEREIAIGMVLSQRFTPRRVAKEHGMNEDQLLRLVERYRRAGRAAIDQDE